MSPVALTPTERSVFDLIYTQLRQKEITAEQACDQVYRLVIDSDNDIPSIQKRWMAPLAANETQLDRIQTVLKKMVLFLLNHSTSTRIGNSIKEQFLTLWHTVLYALIVIPNYRDLEKWVAEEITKKIFQVKDIRWLLKDMESFIIAYRLFRFAPYQITPSLEKMSRDNYYLLKSYCEDDETMHPSIESINDADLISTLLRDKKTYFTKWLTCDLCRLDRVEALRAVLDQGCPFNVRDQPSASTDELEVALRNGSLQCIRLLQEYEAKESRAFTLEARHFDVLRAHQHFLVLKQLAKPEDISVSDLNKIAELEPKAPAPVTKDPVKLDDSPLTPEEVGLLRKMGRIDALKILTPEMMTDEEKEQWKFIDIPEELLPELKESKGYSPGLMRESIKFVKSLGVSKLCTPNMTTYFSNIYGPLSIRIWLMKKQSQSKGCDLDQLECNDAITSNTSVHSIASTSAPSSPSVACKVDSDSCDTLPSIILSEYFYKTPRGSLLARYNNKVRFNRKEEDHAVILYYKPGAELSVMENILLGLKREMPSIKFYKAICDIQDPTNAWFADLYQPRGDDTINIRMYYYGTECYCHLDPQDRFDHPVYPSEYKGAKLDKLTHHIRSAIVSLFEQRTLLPTHHEYTDLQQRFSALDENQVLTVKDLEQYYKYKQTEKDHKVWYEVHTTDIFPYNDQSADKENTTKQSLYQPYEEANWLFDPSQQDHLERIGHKLLRHKFNEIKDEMQ